MNTRTLKIKLHNVPSVGSFSIKLEAILPAGDGKPQRAQLTVLDYGPERGRSYRQLPKARIWPTQFVAKRDFREVENEFSYEVLDLRQRYVRLRISSPRLLQITRGYVPNRTLRVVT